jgi:hypothetical protein
MVFLFAEDPAHYRQFHSTYPWRTILRLLTAKVVGVADREMTTSNQGDDIDLVRSCTANQNTTVSLPTLSFAFR